MSDFLQYNISTQQTRYIVTTMASPYGLALDCEWAFVSDGIGSLLQD